MSGWLETLRRWLSPSRSVRFDDCLDAALEQTPLALRVEAWERSLPLDTNRAAPRGAIESPATIPVRRIPLTPQP